MTYQEALQKMTKLIMASFKERNKAITTKQAQALAKHISQFDNSDWYVLAKRAGYDYVIIKDKEAQKEILEGEHIQVEFKSPVKIFRVF